MNDQEFDRQYEKAGRRLTGVEKFIQELPAYLFFTQLSNAKLFDALWERLEEAGINCEEEEMAIILGEIATRMEPIETDPHS